MRDGCRLPSHNLHPFLSLLYQAVYSLQNFMLPNCCRRSRVPPFRIADSPFLPELRAPIPDPTQSSLATLISLPSHHLLSGQHPQVQHRTTTTTISPLQALPPSQTNISKFRCSPTFPPVSLIPLSQTKNHNNTQRTHLPIIALPPPTPKLKSNTCPPLPPPHQNTLPPPLLATAHNPPLPSSLTYRDYTISKASPSKQMK